MFSSLARLKVCIYHKEGREGLHYGLRITRQDFQRLLSANRGQCIYLLLCKYTYVEHLLLSRMLLNLGIEMHIVQQNTQL